MNVDFFILAGEWKPLNIALHFENEKKLHDFYGLMLAGITVLEQQKKSLIAIL